MLFLVFVPRFPELFLLLYYCTICLESYLSFHELADEVLIHQIIAMARQRGIAPTQFEFQMLLGVCEPLRDQLVKNGFSVRIYLPYGSDWYAYSIRRMKENPRIVGYVMKAMLRR